jgi:hypothetical protein
VGGGKLADRMRTKVVASLVVLGIAALPACSAASDAGSAMSNTSTSRSNTSATGPQTSSTRSTAGSGSTPVGAARSARIRVTPATGQRHAHFVVAFTAPERTGTFSGAIRRYQVGAATQQGQACVSNAAKSVGASSAGARVSVTLTPVGGSAWCTGTYKGRIIETTMPRCAPGKVCPAFIGVLHVVGTFRFRVS